MDRECSTSMPASSSCVEQAPQRGDAAVAGHLQRSSCSSSGAAPSSRPAAARSASRLGELEPDVAAGDAPLELVGGALGDDPAVVEHRDPVGELVGLVEVLGGEEDRHAVGDELADDCPTSCGGCAGRARWSARRGRSPAACRPASSPGRGGGASRRSRSTPACRRRRRGRTARAARRSARRGRRRGRGGAGRPSAAGSPRR